MSYSPDEVDQVRQFASGIVERMKNDPDFLQQVRENPLDMLRAEGLPLTASALLLRETGYPNLETDNFIPRNEAEYEAAWATKVAPCNRYRTCLLTCLTTIWCTEHPGGKTMPDISVLPPPNLLGGVDDPPFSPPAHPIGDD